MDKVEKRRSFIINILYAAIWIGIGYLCIKYALGVIWPFVVSLFFAMLLQRPVNAMARKTPLKRGISSVIMVLLIVVLAGSIVGFIVVRITIELRDFFRYLLMKIEDAPSFASQIMQWFRNAVAFLPDTLEQTVTASVESFVNRLLGIETELNAAAPAAADSGIDFSVLSSPLGAVWGTAKQIPMFAAGLLVCIVSCCFMTADYHNLRDGILRQFKPASQAAVVRAKQVTFSTIGKMGKSYSIIIGITFSEMVIGLSVLKLCRLYTGGYIFAIALVTAVVDIMPVLGTGTILIPWAVISFCTGKFGLGVGLLVLYTIIGIIRQIVEPKLVSAQLGLPPYLTLAAMYIGTQLFGFFGLFLLPLLLTLLKVLNDEGILHILKPAPAKVAAADNSAEPPCAEPAVDGEKEEKH
ncbi:MAG: sporulation integral membrane protein YtvI, partial [Candidatus Fimenecus sp.]